MYVYPAICNGLQRSFTQKENKNGEIIGSAVCRIKNS